MSDAPCESIERVGTSTDGFEDAIASAVERAGRSMRDLPWLEVPERRGHLEDGDVSA